VSQIVTGGCSAAVSCQNCHSGQALLSLAGTSVRCQVPVAVKGLSMLTSCLSKPQDYIWKGKILKC
jgi:hypothetical protein